MTVTHTRRRRLTPAGIELPRSDGRLWASRRFRALCIALEQEIGGALSELDKAAVCAASALQVRLEKIQLDLVAGRDVPADEFVRLSSEHRRIVSSLRAKSAKRATMTIRERLLSGAA